MSSLRVMDLTCNYSVVETELLFSTNKLATTTSEHFVNRKHVNIQKQMSLVHFQLNVHFKVCFIFYVPPSIIIHQKKDSVS